jgi:hypothetical protein
MRIRSHSESHIVELDDGSRWKIFPGHLDITLGWTPETDLSVETNRDGVCTHELISLEDSSTVGVIPETEEWSARDVKNVLKAR